MPKIDISRTNKDQKVYRTLSLILTRSCNLSCSYCYEKSDMRDNRKMDIEIAKKTIAFYMDENKYSGLEIEFFGGEPMLCFPLIQDIVEWFHSRKWEKKHIFLIGTNGTILNNEIKKWLYKNKSCVTIALSIDGCKKAHDLSRDNSFDIIQSNLPFFINNWPNQPAKMTICAETLPYVAESVIYLEKMGLVFTANIGFENIWGTEKEKSNLLDIYENQLSLLVDYYVQHPDLFPVRPILTAIPEYLGIPNLESVKKNEIIKFCGAGSAMTVVDVDGEEYPCHRFLPWITGKEAPKHQVNCQTSWKPESCDNCILIPSCPTCIGYNWEINNDDRIRSTFHCDSYKLEVLASCKLEALRLIQKLEGRDILTNNEKKQIKIRIETLWYLIDEGI